MIYKVTFFGHVCFVLGGYKGFGLGLMVEVFCGMLAGSQYSRYIRTWRVTDRAANLVCVQPFCQIAECNRLKASSFKLPAGNVARPPLGPLIHIYADTALCWAFRHTTVVSPEPRVSFSFSLQVCKYLSSNCYLNYIHLI